MCTRYNHLLTVSKSDSSNDSSNSLGISDEYGVSYNKSHGTVDDSLLRFPRSLQVRV